MQDPIAAVITALAESAARLGALRHPEPRWHLPPTDGGWPAHEALAHLRSADDIFRPRLLQVVVRDEPLQISLDERRWQAAAGYDRLPAARLISGFVSLREELLHALRALPADAWQRAGIHEERGPLTLQQMAERMAAHERDHVDQIETALAASA